MKKPMPSDRGGMVRMDLAMSYPRLRCGSVMTYNNAGVPRVAEAVSKLKPQAVLRRSATGLYRLDVPLP